MSFATEIEALFTNAIQCFAHMSSLGHPLDRTSATGSISSHSSKNETMQLQSAQRQLLRARCKMQCTKLQSAQRQLLRARCKLQCAYFRSLLHRSMVRIAFFLQVFDHPYLLMQITITQEPMKPWKRSHASMANFPK